MEKNVDYNSLMDELNELNIKKNNYRKDIREVIESQNNSGVHYHRNFKEFAIGKLGEIQDFANKGNFKSSLESGKAFYDVLLKGNHFSDEIDKMNEKDKQKYIKSLSKRLDRTSKFAIKYMQNNGEDVTQKRIEEVKDFLNYSKKIKEDLPDEGNNNSSLEKTLKVIPLAFALAGVFFLSPNITGNVIGNMSNSGSNFLGAGLFFLGILGILLTRKK
jgi:hypothetical protein